MQTEIFVAGNRMSVAVGLLSGAALYNLAQIDPARQYLLLELPDDRDIPISASDYIIIDGKERFSLATGDYPADDNPLVRKTIKVVVNEEPLRPEHRLLYAKQTFEQLAALDEHFEPGDGVFVELRDVPDAQVTAGMRVLVQDRDRFYTSPCGNVGYESRLERDLSMLRSQYPRVDCTDDGARSLMRVFEVPLGAQWNRTSTDVLVQVPQSYPMGALDMFWVVPGLRLADGRMPQNADLIEIFLGCEWQRFSWHYPPGYAWNPATDGLLRHMRMVRNRLSLSN